MVQEANDKHAEPVSRRAALIRLGLGSLVAYTAPAFLTLSQAHAESSDASKASEASEPSPASPPSAPSGVGKGGRANRTPDLDLCNNPTGGSGGASISTKDYRQAQKAVARGQALPLRDVFASVQRKMGGKILDVRFSNSKRQAIYDLRMIAGNGDLVVVRVQAATGNILKIAGC